ncbi:HIT-like protein [Coccomyxa subellipsoidea C-169]|uniref:HIT-like protein n=1 Tax=Coccomyxa subellipsoidea (strain C-169) TaxID=574566 RepID=I0YZ64_COCSC|nr:HIT-like protein [Coccomyxa subellipsoidea C-169]EIE23683.1 HIT-like protein [Coccomyxa subellipsoidea C-169]|eukprot:XP_005648227.1 HIT-like protein [Coccomyxa subellipsoidea C-169]
MAFGSLAAPAFLLGVVAAFFRPTIPSRKKGLKGKPRDGFKLLPELAEGKHEVACYDLCKIFLMEDANYPCWIVLVPQINDVKEVIELSDTDQRLLWEEVARASRTLKKEFDPACKLNIATLGNVVSQLHVHITLRIPSDPAWPGPCYGALPATPYTDDALTALLAKLRAAF